MPRYAKACQGMPRHAKAWHGMPWHAMACLGTLRGAWAPKGGPGPLAQPPSGCQGSFGDPKYGKSMPKVCQNSEFILLEYLWHTFSYFWQTFGICILSVILFAYVFHTFHYL